MAKIFKPRYFDEFSCIAGACEDSCCRAGWEIPIDDVTFEVYSKLSGDIGEKFKGSYVMGGDGDTVFKLDENKVCPFLDQNGLCELYIATDGHLCEICTRYPRFKEEFDGFIEEGISVSCPEAQRLILSATKEDYPDGKRDSEDELLEFLADSRKTALDLLGEKNAKEILLSLLDYSDFLQELIDFGELESLGAYEPMEYPKASEESDLIEKINAMARDELDILYHELKEKLSGTYDFKEPKNFSQYITYLINRFWLRSINTEDISSTAKAIVMIAIWCATFSGDEKENMRLLAKELEHGEGNFETLCEIMSRVSSSDLATLIFTL